METTAKNIIPETNIQKDETVIECRHLRKSFGSNMVLSDFNLVINKGENVVVMGKSGIGKTVLIKCIIGLTQPDSGTVKVFGQDISKLSKRELDELRMRIGFVFQSSALYDSMTVRENLEFPLRRHRRAKITRNVEELVREVLREVGLEQATKVIYMGTFASCKPRKAPKTTT